MRGYISKAVELAVAAFQFGRAQRHPLFQRIVQGLQLGLRLPQILLAREQFGLALAQHPGHPIKRQRQVVQLVGPRPHGRGGLPIAPGQARTGADQLVDTPQQQPVAADPDRGQRCEQGCADGGEVAQGGLPHRSVKHFRRAPDAQPHLVAAGPANGNESVQALHTVNPPRLYHA